MTTVLVTGASAGFGAAIVRRFAESGARVIATARRAAAVHVGMQPLAAEDIAAAVAWAVGQPAHVNVNLIELMPVAQSFVPFQVHRQ